MTQYIKKSALVAEIEKIIKEYQSTGDDYWFPVIENLKVILSFINTLEVKEVDLDLEITLWANAIPEIRFDDVERLAKHFFELGLKTQHSSIDISNIDDLFEEDGLDPNSKEAKVFKECYYMALEKLKEKIV